MSNSSGSSGSSGMMMISLLMACCGSSCLVVAAIIMYQLFTCDLLGEEMLCLNSDSTTTSGSTFGTDTGEYYNTVSGSPTDYTTSTTTGGGSEGGGAPPAPGAPSTQEEKPATSEKTLLTGGLYHIKVSSDVAFRYPFLTPGGVGEGAGCDKEFDISLHGIAEGGKYVATLASGTRVHWELVSTGTANEFLMRNKWRTDTCKEEGYLVEIAPEERKSGDDATTAVVIWRVRNDAEKTNYGKWIIKASGQTKQKNPVFTIQNKQSKRFLRILDETNTRLGARFDASGTKTPQKFEFWKV
jgi:hypothetical protein